MGKTYDIERDPVLEFIGQKSYTFSIRLKVDEIKDLIEGKELLVKIKGIDFTIKRKDK
jgi:hypothetical protein